MAIDPKEQVGPDVIWEPGYPDRTQMPNGVTLPSGVTTDGDYYAIVKKYRDGTSDVTWYKRKTAPKGSTADPPFGPTVPGPVAAATQKQYEDDVAKEAAAARTAGGDTTVQGQQSRVQVNPSSGQPEYATIFPATAANPTPQISYRPATAAELAQAGYTGRTEGSPRPDGSFDNEDPRWVVRGPDNQIYGTPRALTDDERKAWNISRQMSRNPGGLSDADLRAQQTQTARQPVDGHPGYSVVKTVNPQTGQTETHYEKDDAPGVTVQLPPAAAQSRTNPTNNHFEELDPATGQWVDRGLIQSKPIIRPNPVTGTDEQVQEVPDGKGGVKLIVRPIERQGGDASTPSDAPNVDLSDPQKAYDSFMRLYQWASSKVARGEQTPTWLENVLKGPHEAVSTVLDREKEMTRRAENTQGNQLTQRSQDISFADNRLSNATQGLQTATSAADKINSLAGPGLHAYSSTLLGTLALQGLQNQALGGTNTLPASVIPGPAGGPAWSGHAGPASGSRAGRRSGPGRGRPSAGDGCPGSGGRAGLRRRHGDQRRRDRPQRGEPARRH